MDCGVPGLLGPLAVKRVETVHGGGNDFAIIQNQPSMDHIAWVLDIRNRTAVIFLLVQVHDFLHFVFTFGSCVILCDH